MKGLWFLAAVLALLGMSSCAFGGYTYTTSELRDWGVVDGVVSERVATKKSFRVGSRGRKSKPVDAVRMTYRYNVGGKAYSVQKTHVSSNPEASAQLGAKRRIHYDKQDPSFGVLSPPSIAYIILLFVAGLILTAASGAMVLIARAMKRRP